MPGWLAQLGVWGYRPEACGSLLCAASSAGHFHTLQPPRKHRCHTSTSLQGGAVRLQITSNSQGAQVQDGWRWLNLIFLPFHISALRRSPSTCEGKPEPLWCKSLPSQDRTGPPPPQLCSRHPKYLAAPQASQTLHHNLSLQPLVPPLKNAISYFWAFLVVQW